MINKKVFDVLIVYAGEVASSALDKGSHTSPFPQQKGRSNYNHAYAYFLEACQNSGLSAAFSTSNDIIDAGTCKSYWAYHDNSWQKFNKICYSRQIFEKFSPVDTYKTYKKKLLFSSERIRPFNNKQVFATFFDKYNTYKQLPTYTIPTVGLDSKSPQTIQNSLGKLKQLIAEHPTSEDFDSMLVLKDRYGAGGNNVYKVASASEIELLIQDKPHISFIIQPYIHFDKGLRYQNTDTAADIRLIYHNGEILQTYLRIASENDFRCNGHYGAEVVYTNLSDIPKKVIDVSTEIASHFTDQNSLFSLDFIISNYGNVYLIEGNTGPGINWNPSDKKDELMAKELIKSIVDEITDRRDSLDVAN